ELIFSEGSQGNCAYIIESGRVEIFVEAKSHPISLKVLSAGDIFGEMAVIDASPRSASAKALEDCCCMVVSSSQIFERIQSSDAIVKLLIGMLLNRTRECNRHLKSNAEAVFSLPFLRKLSDRTSSEDQQQLQVIEKMRMESEFQKAIGNDELIPYYQPLVDLNTGTVVGFELLMRWKSPKWGMVSPDLFINLAEETSLIIPTGFWALEKACVHLQNFQQVFSAAAPTAKPLFISVNVSARQFQHPDFFNTLMKIIGDHGVSPDQIKLEVTERIFLEGSVAIAAIQQCREAGFSISLDDFGTGFSSLNYIARCEVDSLKIDLSFVRQMFSNGKTPVLMQTIIDLAKGLHIPSCAEGIETRDQMNMLQNLGCDLGQGYLFGKPMPFEAALAFLASPPEWQ
ncbi:MAG TPA: EAL domain-containing protein, partial [Leptolyngbyaceae cyanobacterium]